MSEAGAASVSAQHPIRLRVTDDLRRTRSTVFFRLFLGIPHFFWEALLSIVVILAVLANWFATLFAGQSPPGLHSFIAGYLRYATHVSAYMFLIADPYPGFFLINLKQDYPVDLEVDPPEVQSRWTVGFRIILAIPAMIITQILRSCRAPWPSSAGSSRSSRRACRKGSGTSARSRSATRRRPTRTSRC